MLSDVADILGANENLADTGDPQSEEAILDAEHQLGVTFPEAFRQYLSDWGWLAFGPTEYFGLGSDTNDCVQVTKRARDRAALPSGLVVICDHEGDELVCLDTGKTTGGDCPVVVWDVPTRSLSRKRAESFQSFLVSDLKTFLI